MKTQTIILIFASFLINLISCTKPSPSENFLEMSTSTIKSGDPVWDYYKDGVQETNLDSLIDFRIAFVDVATNKVFFFMSDVPFIEWAEENIYYVDSIRIDILSIHNNLDSISDYAFATGADEYFDHYGVISNDMLSYMHAHGMPENTRNEARRLFDNPNYQNSIHISALIPIPTLGNANNRAESLQQIGVAALNAYCDRTWFRGPRIYIFTLGGVYGIPNLGVLNFNNKCESIFPVL